MADLYVRPSQGGDAEVMALFRLLPTYHLSHFNLHLHRRQASRTATNPHSPTEDERSIGNRLAAAEPQNDDTSGKSKTSEQYAGEQDATAPARMHGNEPSRGAQIDKELQDEEAELIAKKDAAKASKKSKN